MQLEVLQFIVVQETLVALGKQELTNLLAKTLQAYTQEDNGF